MVWFTSKSAFDRSIGHDCRFYVIEAPYKEIWAFPFRKKSPLREILNRATAPFRESGLAQASAMKYNTSSCVEKFNKGPQQPSLGSSTTNAAFCFCVCGMFAAFLVLSVEMTVHRWYKRAVETYNMMDIVVSDLNRRFYYLHSVNAAYESN